MIAKEPTGIGRANGAAWFVLWATVTKEQALLGATMRQRWGRESLVMPVRSGKLKARTVAVAALDSADVEAMWQLFHLYYDEVSRERFEGDLRGKDDIILLRDGGDGSIQGFSTLKVLRRQAGDRKFAAIFSGDTVVSRAYWGQTALQLAFNAYTFRKMVRYRSMPVYWFLISKGYKTYLLLTRNYVEHWPRWEQPTPDFQRAVIDLLAQEMFGDAWNPDAGVLQFSEPHGKVKSDVADIDTDLLRQYQDIQFFAEKNPGHSKGDELCCLGRVDVAQVLDITKRQLMKMMGIRPRSTVWKKS